MMKTERAQYLVLRPPKREQKPCGLFAILVGVMKGARSFFHFVMLTALHDYKVIRGVVGAIAINVMHHFVTLQRSAQHLLGDYAVLVQKIGAHFSNDTIACACHVPALPVPVIFPELATDTLGFPTPYWAFSKLVESGGAKSFVTKGAVLLGGHLMGDA